MIKAELITHSMSPKGDELMTFVVTFPRIILAEVNTHREFSRNSASSRAIPFRRILEVIENNPFIPIAFQKEHVGMQGTEYHTGREDEVIRSTWLKAKSDAVTQAKYLTEKGVTKQIVNRLLEPFMWHTAIITTSKSGLDNFFNLRCPQYSFINSQDREEIRRSRKEVIKWRLHVDGWNRDSIEELENRTEVDWLKTNKGMAEIHMMALAEAMYDAYEDSTPTQLYAGDWHIPFYNHMQKSGISMYGPLVSVKIATAMCARVSYTTIGEEKEINYEDLVKLHDRLITQNPLHASPMEHIAKVMTEDEYDSFYRGAKANEGHLGIEINRGWCYNLKGFISYRYLLEHKKL